MNGMENSSRVINGSGGMSTNDNSIPAQTG